MTPKPPVLPQRPKDRFEVYRLLDGISGEGGQVLPQGRPRHPLVKSFLVEHVSATRGRKVTSPQDIWSRMEGAPHPIDSEFFSIQGEVKNESGVPYQTTVGYLERFDERFFAYYTVEDSQTSRKRVAKWIQRSPDLDSCWFNSDLLQTLWNEDVSQRGDLRFGKLTFKHESIFEMPDNADEIDDEQEEEEADSETEDRDNRERRHARFDMSDRIGKIKRSLSNLQSEYIPLYALYSLRFPSRLGHGCHDLYQHGQITNRSESFEDHRSTVFNLYQIYKGVLERTETKAWNDPETIWPANKGTPSNKGVPLIVNFAEALNEATFTQWISRAFRKNNVFRLWGEPIWLGPTKVHVYGADRHLWQPLNLEITQKGMVAILPKGTCGNTFHRLVTNIQRYVCPKVDAWVGSTPLSELMATAATGKERAHET